MAEESEGLNPDALNAIRSDVLGKWGDLQVNINMSCQVFYELLSSVSTSHYSELEMKVNHAEFKRKLFSVNHNVKSQYVTQLNETLSRTRYLARRKI